VGNTQIRPICRKIAVKRQTVLGGGGGGGGGDITHHPSPTTDAEEEQATDRITACVRACVSELQD
jgi:hypothetical protein